MDLAGKDFKAFIEEAMKVYSRQESRDALRRQNPNGNKRSKTMEGVFMKAPETFTHPEAGTDGKLINNKLVDKAITDQQARAAIEPRSSQKRCSSWIPSNLSKEQLLKSCKTSANRFKIDNAEPPPLWKRRSSNSYKQESYH